MRGSLLFLVLFLASAATAGCSGTQLLNTLTPSGGYRQATGITFDVPHRLTLDIYTPVSARGAPVVVFFYGGRWTSGTTADFHFVGQALASQGFVAIVPEYRHYPVARFPAFVQDAARAVRWAETQAERYGGDPRKLFVMGHSSGAHLAAMLALAPEFLAEAGGDRDRLKGMIGLAGPYDFLPLVDADLRDMFGPPERYELSQPIAHVDGQNPPLLLLHGEDDQTVRVRNTRNLAERVHSAGGPVEAFFYPEMSHSWILATLAAPLRGRSDVLNRVGDFVRDRAVNSPSSLVPEKPR
ncbi:MAG TPA: alpha/beta hydrolase [Verrucomicrobiae bacterium]|nr:alpha/beta hydrolase [Verrucomicrobiae bacterium]